MSAPSREHKSFVVHAWQYYILTTLCHHVRRLRSAAEHICGQSLVCNSLSYSLSRRRLPSFTSLMENSLTGKSAAISLYLLVVRLHEPQQCPLTHNCYTALWILDYIQTLPMEVEAIWMNKMSATSILFLLNRYVFIWYLVCQIIFGMPGTMSNGA